MGSIKNLIATLGQNARCAAKELRSASTKQKNTALKNIATQIDNNRKDILSANQKDLSQGKNKGLDAALLDRLMLDDARLDGIIESLNQVANLADPVGEITDLKYRPSGIQVGKMRMPLGVIAIVYESRPNVTIDASALCLKSGNGAILRGGSEAINSNLALYACVKQGLIEANLDENCVQLISTTDRKVVSELAQAEGFIDALIPRGGKGLVEAISADAKVLVIKHLHGVCHTYIDKDADSKKAIDIAFNGKARRYGVCNATETLLVHSAAAGRVMSELIAEFATKGVELRGCKEAQKFSKQIKPASQQDWDTEYLDAILSIRIVSSMSAAIDHIEKHGSGHTEAIVSENYSSARRFMTEVDSSSIMVNASTAFADGFEYGHATMTFAI
ncbi:MAG: glutamate-5-semialdehyde dehydrogenase [Candidatus Thioglobus sp.]|nr:MAG: glutamate-5-semialdehyde dehydrogenase [Candidatus Thioglobus sp.]